jgi:hypothetical protein
MTHPNEPELQSISFTGERLNDLPEQAIAELGSFAAKYGLNFLMEGDSEEYAVAHGVPSGDESPAPFVNIRFNTVVRSDQAVPTFLKMMRVLRGGGVAFKADVDALQHNWDDMTPEMLEREMVLDTNVMNVLPEFALEPLATRAGNTLNRADLHTLRHLLVAGKQPVYRLGYLGPQGKDAVNEMMRSRGLHEEWKNNPTMHDIVQYCRSLDTLPAFLIECPAPNSSYKHLSVKDVVALSLDQLTMIVRTGHGMPDREAAKIVMQNAQAVAQDFLSAQASAKSQGL